MVKDSNSTNLTSINTAFDSTTGDLRINELGDSSKDKTGYVSINKSVNITPRALEVYTADVSVQARAYLAGPDCPRISVTMFVSGLQTDSKNLEYCDGTDWQEKTVELELGSGGYVGPEKVVVEYINDYSATADRNIDLGRINVKFNNITHNKQLLRRIWTKHVDYMTQLQLTWVLQIQRVMATDWVRSNPLPESR